MYIANFLAGILKNHSKVSGITVQDELGRLWKGGVIRKKLKQTVGYQEVPHPMFVGYNPAFEHKSEVSMH